MVAGLLVGFQFRQQQLAHYFLSNLIMLVSESLLYNEAIAIQGNPVGLD